jgi:glycerophosphoryl diester phosphodiesterase
MVIVGHRGARGLAPENTIAALNKAIEHSADEIEIDIRVTKDHIPILFHNLNLKLPGSPALKINRTNYTELKEHLSDLITLKEAMEHLNNRIHLCIEVKEKKDLKPVLEVINDQLNNGWQLSRVSIASFNYQTLSYFKQRLPGIQLVVNEMWSGVRAHIRAKQLNTKRINLQQRWLWSGYTRPLSKRGYKLYAFTVNDQPTAERMEKCRVAGIITDYPDLFEKAKE